MQIRLNCAFNGFLLHLLIMLRRGLFIAFVIGTHFCFSQAKDTGKVHRYFFEANGGSGHFVKPHFVSSKNSALAGNYSLNAPACIGFGTGINFHYSKKSFVERFLSLGISVNYMGYKVNHQFENYVTGTKYTHFYHEFSQNSLSYYVNTINPSVFLSNSIMYPGGFFVRNKFGLSFTTYLNKKAFTYTEHVTGSESMVGFPPTTRYYEWTSTVREYNYDKVTYSAYYNLSLGTRIKNTILYVSPEILFMDNQLHMVLKYQAGILFFL